MLNLESLNDALDKFGYGAPEANPEVIANRALKRATITLLTRVSDPEAIFIGAMLTDTMRIMSYDTLFIDVKLNASTVVIEANPKWVAYLDSISDSTDYLIRELRHCLMHLVLMHPESIKAYKDNNSRAMADLAMDVEINDYLSRHPSYSHIRPLCPECLYKYKTLNKKISLIPGDIASKSCHLCYGAGHLANDEVRVICAAMAATSQKYSSPPKFKLPYGHTIGNHKSILPEIEALSKEFLSADGSPNIYELTQGNAVTEFENSYDKSLAISALNHAYAQTKSHSKGGSPGGLLDIFSKLRKEKKVPYLLRLRGVLGASMRDESEATRYRPNRRFGYDYPGSKSIPKQRYVFAIDTSGSVPLDELKKILNEFTNISNYSDKIECRVLFFHHDVYYDKEIKDYSEADLKNLQSGGTNFDRVLSAVYDDKSKERGPAVLVFYTDGYCSIRFEKRKVQGSVHWLITKDGSVSDIKRWDKDASVIMLEN